MCNVIWNNRPEQYAGNTCGGTTFFPLAGLEGHIDKNLRYQVEYEDVKLYWSNRKINSFPNPDLMTSAVCPSKVDDAHQEETRHLLLHVMDEVCDIIGRISMSDLMSVTWDNYERLQKLLGARYEHTCYPFMMLKCKVVLVNELGCIQMLCSTCTISCSSKSHLFYLCYYLISVLC